MLLRLLSVVSALISSLSVTHASHPAVIRSTTAVRPQVVQAPAPAASARATAAPTSTVYGADMSWPNCPPDVGPVGLRGYGLPKPLPAARFLVLGATNGPAFTSDVCLAALTAWARARQLPMAAYAVIHYPNAAEVRQHGGQGSLTTVLRRVGAAEARSALAALRAANVPVPMVWVDVETVGGRPWSRYVDRNRALLSGVFAAYQHAGIPVGLYSYGYAWTHSMGALRLPKVPTWVPSGGTTYREALATCSRPSFSGGRVLMTQWTVGSRDHNITCPGVGTAGLFLGG